MSKKVSIIAKISIVLLCFIFYGSTLTNDYSLDDHYVIDNNLKVANGIKGIPDLYTSHYIETNQQSYAYRPVTLTTFAIEYEFFGANPFISHLVNVALYSLTCLLLFIILTRILKDYHWLFPLLITGLFLIHPIHAEVVNNIKCRDELLSFLFALLALQTAITYMRKHNIWYLIAALVLLIISLMSKLSSMTFVAIVPLTLYFFENLKGRKLIMIIVSCLMVFVVFKFGARALVDSETKVRELLFIENPFYILEGNMFTRIPMAFYTVGYYIKLLVWPYPLLFYYGYDHVPIVGWNSLWGWISIIAILPLGVYTIIKLKTKHVLIFGLAYFFISISMFSNLVVPAVGIIAERFAYIPSLGFCIVLAYIVLKISKVPVSEKEGEWKKKTVLIGIFSLFTLSAGAYILNRNTDWENKLTLAQNDSKHLKNSAKANALVGDYLLKDMRVAKSNEIRERLANNAIFYYKRSLKVYKDNGSVNNNLGVIYHTLGNYETAIEFFQKAHKQGVSTSNSYFNLGAAYKMQGDPKNAATNFETSIRIDPAYVNSYNQLTRLYFETQQYTKALEVNLRALKQFPNQQEVLVKSGQKIAEAQYGAGTDNYINLLRERGIIDQNLYNQIKQRLIQ